MADPIERTIRDALTACILGFNAALSGTQLNAAERSLVQNCIDTCNTALLRLRVDNTIQPGLRQGTVNPMFDAIHSTITVDQQHGFAPAFLYDYLDLMGDAAEQISLGVPTFISSLSG